MSFLLGSKEETEPAKNDGVSDESITQAPGGEGKGENGSEVGAGNWIDSIVFNGIKWAIENEKSDLDGEYDPTAVICKLQEMLKIVAAKTEQVSSKDVRELPWYAWLSLIQLNEAAKKTNPEFRDNTFRDGGDADVRRSELVDLAEGVELADLAYETSYFKLKKKLESLSYALLRHDASTEPGRVGHYIAIDHKRKIALIGLKGTSTFSDLVTDCVGKSYEHTLDGPFDSSYSSESIRLHEGIWQAAMTMADDTEELVRNLFLPATYRVLICGHSLGGGVACLLGLLLRSRIPALHGGPKLLRVIAVASPPVLNYRAALAARSFCTTLVNNSDIVPRMSLSNLVIFTKSLVMIDKRLKEQGRAPVDFASAIAYTKDVLDLDREPIATFAEIEAFFEEHRKDDFMNHKDNLFVPGRIILMWGVKEAAKSDEKKAGVVTNDSTSSQIGEKGDEGMATAVQAEMAKIRQINVVANEPGTRMLRQIDLERTFLDDHGTVFYKAAIRTLVNQSKEREECSTPAASNVLSLCGAW